MDTRQLKVGQIVMLRSGWYGCHAKVLEITPEGVIVEDITYPGKAFRLDINGRAVDSRDLGWNTNRLYNDALPIPGTYEGGPWELKGISADKGAVFEQASTKK